ncbi:MAG: cytochrome c3 family protein [Gammaproteobacteria bacterium]|nr:cytochrome c3 family protein [Gammaproteobacteria bacterium]
MTKWAIRWIVATTSLMPYILYAGIGDGIQGTAHDFSGSGESTTSSCAFCHTPHEAQDQTLAWNHTLSTNTFSWSRATTSGGTPYPTIQGDTYSGPTAKCLSCHDGTVAIGDIAWWNGGPVSSPVDNTRISGAAQTASSSGRMDENHPVAMPFPWDNAPSTYNGVTTGTGVALGDWQPDPEALGIRLYNDDGSGMISSGAVAGQTGMECTSCHDPHNGSTVESAAFLRGTTANICTKCHKK